MMLYKPTLIVNRLVATKSGRKVYDEVFGPGFKALFGVNGGGKTSVIQLLTFALGYDIKNWKQEALSCDSAYVELTLNGDIVTARREVGRERAPMDLCFRNLNEALMMGPEEWLSFPYSVSANKESFSQKLFELLGIPEIKAEGGNNITMHQLLRLLYNDQSNPAAAIFNVEQFDTAYKREAIGSYLLGIHDSELYNDKLLLVDAEKQLDRAIDKLRAIYSVLGKTDIPKEFGTIEAVRSEYIQEIDKIRDQAKSQANQPLTYKEEKNTAGRVVSENVALRGALSDCEHKISTLEYDIRDSKEFIAELGGKFMALEDSGEIAAAVPNLEFSFCPSCFSEIPARPDNVCRLCGAEEPKGRAEINLLRMKNEIQLQLAESRRLLGRKEAQLLELSERRKELLRDLRKSITKAEVVSSAENVAREEKLYAAYRRIGELEEKLIQLERTEALYSELGRIARERDTAQSAVNQLKERIEAAEIMLRNREPEVKGLIGDYLKTILRRDVGSEAEFKAAESIDFDFASNRVSVNGKTSFSESSMVLLNNAFHAALLLASLDKEYLRVPRLMILDGIENGGMEDARSRNFQEVIAGMLADKAVTCQLIVATKSLAPSLTGTIVGKKFVEGGKSLAL